MIKAIEVPYSPAILKTLADENGYVSGSVLVPFDEIVHRNFESFLDLLGEKLIGSDCLMDISYKAVEITKDQNVVIWVRGDASGMIETDEE